MSAHTPRQQLGSGHGTSNNTSEANMIQNAVIHEHIDHQRFPDPKFNYEQRPPALRLLFNQHQHGAGINL